MKITRRINSAKFVFTQNECGYQEVLDDFKNSDYVLIMTYNISDKNNNLIDELKRLSENTEVNIYTNIPQRFESYYYEWARKNGKKRIDIYLNRLNPENFDQLIDINFTFNNHSKIIMTNHLVYIGSANFSEESSNNIESGIISDDTEFIGWIKNDVVNFMKENSVPYFDNEFSKLKVLISFRYSELEKLLEEFHHNTHRVFEQAGKSYEYFISENTITITNIDSLDLLIEELEDLLIQIESAIIEENIDSYQQLLEGIEDLSVGLISIRNWYIEGSPLYEYIIFDEEDYALDFIQENSMEAYDEHLDSFAAQGSQDAGEIKGSLAEEASEDVRDFLNHLERARVNLEVVISQLPNSMPNNMIDNT